MVDGDKLTVTGIDPELLKTFETICANNEWTQSEVIAYYLAEMVRDRHRLAWPLHLHRRKPLNKRWVKPEEDDV